MSFNFVTQSLLEETRFGWQQDPQKGWGGPCSVDSGGPIYAGFNRGFWDDPHSLVGITTALRSPDLAVRDGLVLAKSCMDARSEGLGIAIAPYAPAICALSKGEVRGCGG